VSGGKRRRTAPGWTQEAMARWAQLDGRLAHVDPEHYDTVKAKLDAARALLDDPVPHGLWARLSNWWNGDHIEGTWTWLEQAEVDLVEYADERGLEIALAIALKRVNALDETDRRRVALEALAAGGGQGLATPSARTTIEAALVAAFEAINAYHRAARALRNRLIVMTLIALVTASAIVLLQWRIPSATIIERPDGAEGISTWQLTLLVMAFGAIGALLTTIRPISTLPPSGSPFNFPLQQALLKIVVGTLTATVGVIVIGGASVTTGFQSLPALIGAAVVFGAAQQALTQFLDKRAASLIDSGPSNS
jgi:hypothetical protein